MKQVLFAIAIFMLNLPLSFAKDLRPGFDKREYLDLLSIVSSQADTLKPGPNYLTPTDQYKRIFRSNEVGFRNRWDLWLNRDGQTLVVSIRGTVNNAESWLENFYCGMVPAKGEIKLNDSTTFVYRLAENEKAAVHVGWTIGLASMAPDIVSKLKEQYTQRGIKNLYVVGHSQGGALAFLLTSYLRYQIIDGELPADLQIKTYCSAAPKPGNLFYAYDYDFITRGGWAFTVVNALDWVPETPFSLQTLEDFNHLNPFMNIEEVLKKQKPFYVRWYLKHAFNRLDKSTKKARKNFEKHLGRNLFKQAKKILPQLKEPTYVSGMNYMRAGVPIVLQPDSTYYALYPDTGKNVFIHHALKPYAQLVERY